MLSRVISTISIVTILGLISPVCAKPILSSSEQIGKVAQSSKSLQGVYSKNIADYPGLNQNPGTPDISSSRTKALSQSLKNKNSSSQNLLGDNLTIDNGDSLIDSTPDPLRINLNDNEYNSRVSVKYKLNR